MPGTTQTRMKIYRSLSEIPTAFRPTVATIGNFDGVHRGHQWVLGEVIARALLGRPFAIHSTPASGRGYGTKYTVPTINLAPYPDLIPAIGVYITTLTVNGETFDAVTNVGNRPTFGEDSFTIESHLLNFHPIELREDTPLTLTFLHRLRDEIRWPSPEALREQIGHDVRHAKRYFSLCRLLTSQKHPRTLPSSAKRTPPNLSS
jgi:riboflavin kinase/FMN adenylyltransferase